MNSHRTWPGDWHCEQVHPDKPFKAGALKVEKVLYAGESDFQKISVVMTSLYGRALILDRMVVRTERDGWLYNEMMAFLPLSMIHEPKSVMIIGGGDGAVCNEVLKHPTVSQVTIIERDQRVVDLSMRFFEESNTCLRDPRVEIVIGNPVTVSSKHKEEYDVIIVDMFADMSSTAHKVVTAELLHGLQYCMTYEGVMCFQQPSPLINDGALREQMKMFRRYYPSTGYAINIAPTFAQGTVGYALMSRQEGVDFSVPKQGFGVLEARKLGLRCYTTEVHQGSFMCVPSIVRDVVEEEKVGTPSTDSSANWSDRNIYAVISTAVQGKETERERELKSDEWS